MKCADELSFWSIYSNTDIIFQALFCVQFVVHNERLELQVRFFPSIFPPSLQVPSLSRYSEGLSWYLEREPAASPSWTDVT